MPPLSHLRFALITAAISGLAHAADGPSVAISGFGTAAATATDTSGASYARFLQSRGAGNSPISSVDSNLGVQATATISERLSFTAQGLARQNADGNFGAELAWAFAKYAVDKHWTVRVGRMGLPAYMLSDFRNVGYANTMLRPSYEVYSQVPADSFDGADVVYQGDIGGTTLTAQLAAGRGETDLPGGSRAVMKRVTALHVTAQNGPLTLRFGRTDADFDVEDNAVFARLQGDLRAAGLAALADRVRYQDRKGSFTSIGAVYDEGKLMLQSEYAVRRTDTQLIPDSTAWYVLAGYRTGKLMPYAAYGRSKQDDTRSHADAPASGPLLGLGQLANAVSRMPLRSTTTLGLRWDFASAAALKLQADRVRPRDGNGALLDVKPGFAGPVTVYAAGIDFVF